MEEKKEFEKKMLGIASDESIIFTILIENPTLIQKILRKKNRIYEVKKHTTLNQNIKIAKLLIDIPELKIKDLSESELLDKNIEYVAKYSETLIEVISILLKEKDKEFLKNNLSNSDIFAIILEMLGMVDFQAFTTTIVLTRNKTSLQVSE